MSKIVLENNIHVRPLRHLTQLFSEFPIKTWLCISDSNVKSTPLYATLIKQLSADFNVDCYTLLAGERSKSFDSIQQIGEKMLADGHRREIGILAIGGGVVLDCAGLIAALFCRGVPWIAVPTSLMAMVDVCVGGKTGINTRYGKNTFGVIYPAMHSWVDTLWLKTLPNVEFQWALSEVVKVAALADESSVLWLHQCAEAILQQQHDVLVPMIKMALSIKSSYVSGDLQDHHRRGFLNLGHTLAHALECCSAWQMPHGQAVAAGLHLVSGISSSVGFRTQHQQLLKETLLALGLTFSMPEFSTDQLWQVIQKDKKRQVTGTVRWVGLKAFGQPIWMNDVSYTVFFENYTALYQDK